MGRSNSWVSVALAKVLGTGSDGVGDSAWGTTYLVTTELLLDGRLARSR